MNIITLTKTQTAHIAWMDTATSGETCDTCDRAIGNREVLRFDDGASEVTLCVHCVRGAQANGSLKIEP